MRFSYQWLTEWVDTELTAEQAAERLTAAGLEVDEFTTLGEHLDGVVVGRIVACERHPDADRLQVCTVDAGLEEPLQIVCGAPNARQGLFAPVATIGSRLPNGMKIKAAKLRGVASEGMLCSSPELGVGDDASGLLELPVGLVPGTPLVEALNLPDHVIELDLTPNRADCLSIRGIAHELVALDAGGLRTLAFDAVRATIERRMPVDLTSGAGCPRYVGRVIEGVDPTAPTPSWMVQRLERCGIRSLGPIVDVTNYVLLELGQPMHAFDLDRLDSGIRVRRAEAGERLKLLNDQEIELDPDLLVIADHREPVALAGIMGGLPSSVQDSTRDILLESAWFDPAVIIGKARRFGLATDSSHRFERGVDPELQVLAIERATQLIVDIAGGEPGPVVDRVEDADLPQPSTIALRPGRVNHVLGTELEPPAMHDVLVRLGMAVDADADDIDQDACTAALGAPRSCDRRRPDRGNRPRRGLRRPAGARARWAPACPRAERTSNAAGRPGQRAPGARFPGNHFSWSFVAEELLERFGLAAQAQPLANPLSQDMAVLRTSLVPGLVQTVAANLRKQQARIRLYETGHVFEATRGGLRRVRAAGRWRWPVGHGSSRGPPIAGTSISSI
jgi:phenylalanyl-tRNA synthetase beta chain